MDRDKIKKWLEQEMKAPVEFGNVNACIYKTMAIPMDVSDNTVANVVVFKDETGGPLKAAFYPFGQPSRSHT